MGCGSSNAAGSPEHAPYEKQKYPLPNQRQEEPVQNHAYQKQQNEEEKAIDLFNMEDERAEEGNKDEQQEDEKEELEEIKVSSVKGDEEPEDEESEEPETQEDDVAEELVVLDYENVIDAAIKGQINVKYPLTQKIVRIFTSSTFTGR